MSLLHFLNCPALLVVPSVIGAEHLPVFTIDLLKEHPAGTVIEHGIHNIESGVFIFVFLYLTIENVILQGEI